MYSEDINSSESKNSITKAVLTVLIVLLVAAGVYLIVSREQTSPSVFEENLDSREFHGWIAGVDEENSTISLQGSYIVEGRDDLLDNENSQAVEVAIVPATQIIKVIWNVPAEDGSELDGSYVPDESQYEETPGNFADLINKIGAPVAVLTETNIFGKSQFTASVLKYQEVVYPGDELEEE